MMNDKKRVLILGAGFAGIKTAVDLEKNSSDIFDIKIISKNTHMEYYPLLYKIATGKNPMEVCLPLDKVFENKKIDLLIDEVTRIDLVNKKVYGKTLDYDYDILILALGSQSSYFGIPGIEEGTYSFKSADDAIRINRHLHQVFIKHKSLEDAKKEDNLHFVIVGGGPSGLEIAGEFSCYLKSLADLHKIKLEHLHIDLIDSGERLLPMYPNIISDIVFEKLYKLDINVFLNHRVKEQVGNTLNMGDLSIKSDTIIWTAGVMPNKIYKETNGLELDNKGRVIVDGNLMAKNQNDVYVIGDSVSTNNSGTAQSALANGKYIAKYLSNKFIGKYTENYTPKENHLVLPIKKNWGLLFANGFVITGRFAYYMREFIDLYYFASILPFKYAYKLWRDGDQICEQCPICGKYNEDPL